MKCENCNAVIPDSAAECPICHKPVVDEFLKGPQDGQNMNPASDPFMNNSSNIPPHANPGFIPSATTEKTSKKFPLWIFIPLGLVVVLFIAVMIIIAIALGGNGGDDKSDEFNYYLDSIQSPTSSEYIALTGQIETPDAAANLVINGELVATVTKDEELKTWSKNVQLNPGDNVFVISFADNQGRSKSEVITIERTVPLKYPVGTKLVKLNKSGVYIRPTPAVGEKYVIKIDSKDYSTTLECIGEEFTDSENYVWCKVRTPKNGIGWVRSDLMKELN